MNYQMNWFTKQTPSVVDSPGVELKNVGIVDNQHQ